MSATLLEEMARAIADTPAYENYAETKARACAAVVARRLREAMESGGKLATDNNVVKATFMLLNVEALLSELEGGGPPPGGK